MAEESYYYQRPLSNANGEGLTMDANGNGKRTLPKALDDYHRQKQDSDVSLSYLIFILT